MRVSDLTKDITVTARPDRPRHGAPHGLLALQAAAGNRAVTELVRVVQRCGSERHPGCPCADDHAERDGAPVAQAVRADAATAQRQRRGRGGAAGRRAAATPTLGPCHPVQDDLRPTAPWSDLQRGYRARCGTAVDAVVRGVGGAVDDLMHGRMPRARPAPDARSTVDCACAVGTPRQVAVAAMARVFGAGPLAARLFWHFLDASGTDVTIDVADMINRSGGVRAKIQASIARGGMTGTTRLEQSDYHDADLQFAYGAIDCVQWRVLPPAGRRWRSDGNTPIEIRMLDYYEFHPGRPGVSQCAHAACVELVARGEAKNFWTRGDAVVTWAQIRR